MAYLRFEAHVKHAVGLIKDEVGCALHVAGLHLDQIDDAPWGADGHLSTSMHRLRIYRIC